MGKSNRRLLWDAGLTVTGASAVVFLLAFSRAIRFGCAEARTPGEHKMSPEGCVWAVEATVRKLPWRTVCIEKGLAVQRLLRRAGFDARLHYGARHNPETGRLEARVWVSHAGKLIIGAEQATGFAELAVYPESVISRGR